MNYTDKERLGRLTKTFDLNYRVTNLYATYLERFPDLITREMVAALTEDGDVTEKDAVTAILCEAFGLDDAKGGEDRILIREYLRPSVRMLDSRRYTENPYYKNIRIENISDGKWEFKQECYPAFRAMICADMIINPDHSEIPPLGFFNEDFHFPAVLEDGNEWMTLTPIDLDTCDGAIERARGRVITFGLGLGYYAYMVSEKPTVEGITVVERSEKVIELFKKHILPQFSHPEKVRIVCDDAFVYAENTMPKEKYDFAFVDTWRDASDGAPMYERMRRLEHLSPDTEFSYWIEAFLISRIKAIKFEELYRAVMEEREDAPKTYDEFIKELTYGRNIRL